MPNYPKDGVTTFWRIEGVRNSRQRLDFTTKTEATKFAKEQANLNNEVIYILVMKFRPKLNTYTSNSVIKVHPSKRKNPSISLGGSGDGWQAAHAFRQLADGRVQILTNPRGKVPKVRVQKNPSMTTEVYVTFSKKDAEQFRRDIAKHEIPSKIERHVARGGTQFFIITTSSADYAEARRIRESVNGHK